MVETWIPDGGFRIERRKIKTPDGPANLDCLVPALASDELTRDQPLARQPCLHRIMADCPPSPERILYLANHYGLLTVTIHRMAAPGQVVHADALAPEPLDIWRREIRKLRACTDLWEAISAGQNAEQGRELLAHRITERLARAPFHLTVTADGGRLVLSCQPASLIDAVWQQFAREAAGIIRCARCPAPHCGRWFLHSAGRNDRQYCSPACRMRAWRRG